MALLKLFGPQSLKEKLKYKFQSHFQFLKNKDLYDRHKIHSLSKFVKESDPFKQITLKNLQKIVVELDEINTHKG
jgi:hypothetical protein